MPLTLELPQELQHRLTEGAACLGISIEDYTLRILERHVPESARRSAAVALLQSWIDQGNEKEQQETGDFLIRSLDEDRPAERKLFPPELKGVSW